MPTKEPAHHSTPVRLPQVHPTALVDAAARLGAGVVVGPGSVIGPGVEIGDGTEIGAYVVIEGRVRIGKNNRISHGAIIGTAPQDLKYTGADSLVLIGDDNTIREYVTINLATGQGEATRVGNDCLLMAYTHVAHNCVVGDHVVLANAVNLAGHVDVGDYAIIGGMTPVHQFVLIGSHAFIGGYTRVSQDVPPFVKVAGDPPEPAGINSVGLSRRGFSEEQISQVKRAYRSLYRRGLRVEEALVSILADGDDSISSVFRDFFQRSTRGIVR